MIRHINSTRWSTLASISVIAAGLSVGCGGTTTFADSTPIRIAVAPPAPQADLPPPPQKEVKIRNNRMEISEKIQFGYNTAEVLQVSFAMLDELAKVMQENPHVQKVRIEGHASEEGEDAYNMKLSQARAEAIRVYLVAKGVAANRLSSVGYGETKPIASNDTAEGREKNRRVEFTITKQEVTKEKVEVDPSTGDETVIEKTSSNEETER